MSQAEQFEVWRWSSQDSPIVVLILETPQQAGREVWHNVFVLDIELDSQGWRTGMSGVRWTVSTAYGWEKVV